MILPPCKTAAKIARRYWSLLGQPERRAIVSRTFAYHGMNAYGTSLGGIALNHEGIGTLVEDVHVIAHDDPDALEQALDRLGDTAAAFIGEPVIGAGGVLPPPEGYWPAVQYILRERDILFIADEVICGFGRVGTWFGVERYGLTPDIISGHATACAVGLANLAIIDREGLRDRVRTPEPVLDETLRPVAGDRCEASRCSSHRHSS